MSILSRRFASSLWCLKEYIEEVKKLDISEETRNTILISLNKVLTELQLLQNKYKYMRAITK